MARGADRSTAEDIAQEVAYRAMDGAVGFHDLDDFCAWGCTVARNLYIDVVRNRSKFVEIETVPDRATAQDVGDEVEKKLALDRVVIAFHKLKPSDQEAILGGVNHAPAMSRKHGVRDAVRRHRARERLTHLIEGLAAIWALLKGARRFTQASVPVVLVAGAFALAPAVLRGPTASEALPPKGSQVAPDRPVSPAISQPGPVAVAAGTLQAGAPVDAPPSPSSSPSQSAQPPSVRPPSVGPEPSNHACLVDEPSEDGRPTTDPRDCIVPYPKPPVDVPPVPGV